MATEKRVAIRYSTLNVPGLPGERAKRVASDFATLNFSRQFSYDQDFIHLPTDFDSDTSKSVWILCDFNVYNRRSVREIPLEFWKVTYKEESAYAIEPLPQEFLIQTRNFEKREMSGRAYADAFEWGGSDNEWAHRQRTKAPVV